VVLPWYVWIYRAHGWTYISPFFLRDNLGRFASQSLGPARGPLYYTTVYIADFFPWSLMALVAAGLLISSRKSEQPMKSLSWGLPLAWCGLTFVLFSLSKNKQEYYIAPMYPLAAIILSGILDKSLYRSVREGASRAPAAPGPMKIQTAAFRWLYALLCVLFIALSAILAFALRVFMPNLPPVLHYIPSLVFGAAGILTAWSLVRGKIGRCFPILAVSLVTAYWICPWFYLPAAESFRPVKDFCRIIESHSSSDDEAGYYGTALPSMVFYLRRPVFEENDPEGMRRRFESGRRVFCILSEKDYAFFARSGAAALYVLDRRPRLALRMRSLLSSGGSPEEEMLLVSNRPDSAVAFNRNCPTS
jgi:4-amino-4-deoxy-L-arabinose transferase-like glycosyltransferase